MNKRGLEDAFRLGDVKALVQVLLGRSYLLTCLHEFQMLQKLEIGLQHGGPQCKFLVWSFGKDSRTDLKVPQSPFGVKLQIPGENLEPPMPFGVDLFRSLDYGSYKGILVPSFGGYIGIA